MDSIDQHHGRALPSVANALAQVRQRWRPGREAEVAFGIYFVSAVQMLRRNSRAALADLLCELRAIGVAPGAIKEMVSFADAIIRGKA